MTPHLAPHSSPAPAPALPAGMRLGPVHLTVADLDRSVAWWGGVAGLRTREHGMSLAALGAGGEDLVVLHEQPGAQPAGSHAGLFHVALLHDSDAELGHALRRIAASGAQLTGASDHGVSKALYLRDPDHHGVEIYADRPRSQWLGADDRPVMFSAPLDLDEVLSPVAGEDPRPRAGAGLTVGHIHLHVGDVPRAVAFYRDALGMELMTSLPGAAFLAAAGYHHHLAVNTWAGEGVGPAPADAAQLRRWTIVLADADDVAAAGERLLARGAQVAQSGDGLVVRDPWGIELRLTASARA